VGVGAGISEVHRVSAEELAAGAAMTSGPSLGYVDIDELQAMLAAEQAARQRAEAFAAERDSRAAKAEADLRDIAKLRDNFHNLYREERELRETAERTSEAAVEERNRLESDVVRLQSELDRVKRAAVRPAAPAVSGPSSGGKDAALLDLERELGVVISHAAELEGAMAERDAELARATRRVEELELAMAALRTADTAAAGSAADEATTRRIHDLDAELATARAENGDLRAAHERLADKHRQLEQQLAAEQAQRAAAEAVATQADERARQAVGTEAEAVRRHQQAHAAAEHADRDLQAAKAAIAVLEQRLRDAEQARGAAEQHAAEVAEELAFVQSSVLTGRDDRAGRRGLLRRKPTATAPPAGETPPGHVETVGTPVQPAPAVAASSESVDEALHRRLFGDG
jgi:hypothetical protein